MVEPIFHLTNTINYTLQVAIPGEEDERGIRSTFRWFLDGDVRGFCRRSSGGAILAIGAILAMKDGRILNELNIPLERT